MEKLKVDAVIANFEKCSAFIEEHLEAAGIELNAQMKVLTACEEIIVNIMNYAYPEDAGELEIAFADQADYIKITFSDQGKEFNPFAQPEKDITLPIEEREVGGLGILLVKKLMDEVEYEYRDNHNVITITKRL